MIIQRILQIAVLCGAIHLFVYGSTKPPAPPTNTPPMMLSAPRLRMKDNSDKRWDIASPLGIGTNEYWRFDPPEGATVVEKWRRRGAANERIVLDGATETVPPLIDREQIAVDTFGRVWTLGREFALLGRQVGMVPEARWADLGFASLAWWTMTASNSTVVCWQNALLELYHIPNLYECVLSAAQQARQGTLCPAISGCTRN